VQIWNTFGLSHPSRSAECEKMNATGSSNDNSRSLSFMIRSYASTSFCASPELLSSRITSPARVRRCAKYAACTSSARRVCHPSNPTFSSSNAFTNSLRINPSAGA